MSLSSITYSDAVDAALHRLQITGFYLGNFFANHGPMAARRRPLRHHEPVVPGSVGPHDHRACCHPAGPGRATRPAARDSLRTVASVNQELFAAFGGQRSTADHQPAAPGAEQDFVALAAEAVDIGDEHAIKLCEAVTRENALRPDPRYLSAASTALRLIRAR